MISSVPDPASAVQPVSLDLPDGQPSPRESLDAADVAAVHRLVEAATEVDGVTPLNEAALLRLDRPGSARHLLLNEGADVVAYAQVADPGTGELVVRPDARGVGRGGALLTALLDAAPRPLSLWAHGDQPAAAALARTHRLRRSRELWQLRRPLDETLPAVRWPAGVSVRTFRPGADDAGWLALNAEAFAAHPEQGRTTQADLAARTSATWFDPAGFFLAERDEELVGFHWTKVHTAPTPAGEVYVIAVAPSAQGSGLGRALSLHGMHHLRGLGLPEALLYVEADNASAVAVYERLGFTRATTDVAYTAD